MPGPRGAGVPRRDGVDAAVDHEHRPDGSFSSDRTIREYATDIWGVAPERVLDPAAE